MFSRLFIKHRKAKQFHYMPRYGDNKKFNLLYRSIGRMNYAESYVDKKFDNKKSVLEDEIGGGLNANEEKVRIQFRHTYCARHNSSKTVLLILCALVVLILILFGFNLTAVLGQIL